MQVLTTKPPFLRTLLSFASRDGIFSLWTGLTASILRQSTYSTARFGLYNIFAAKLKQSLGTETLSASSTIACAGLAGGLAGLVGNPTEVVLVRMCADGAKAQDKRFGYRNALDGVLRIAKEDGIKAFGRGLTPNVVRSVLMSMLLFPLLFGDLKNGSILTFNFRRRLPDRNVSFHHKPGHLIARLLTPI